MTALGWTPWHQVVRLRDDLRSGELSLSIFAADVNAVAMGTARPVYQKAEEFFALTYPTFNLRELAKDVVLRLAGKNDKAVRQLELTYGGGKTHTLVTLYHLVTDPEHLPKLPAAQEFVQHIGMAPPKTRVSVISFDRLDPQTGMDVRSPDGAVARFKYPWSVLAYQLGGQEGLRILGMGDGGERETPPFTNVLVDLLKLPQQQGMSTLVLMDEVLMWARTKAAENSAWRHRLQDFFQCLTQAATEVERSAVVASLLATDPHKSDALGKEIIQELYGVFRREREKGVEPVLKEDVAEVLRRRFFTPDSIRDRESFRSHVVAALRGIAALDEQTQRDGKAAEDRFLDSYPFHPDLTDAFYSKWTNLEGFQRTRGILRTFALALREAEQWDESPLIAANVFLGKPENPGLSEAAGELIGVAQTEEYEGKRQSWTGILQGELAKAREIQADTAGLRQREVEQAVVAVFLHSQPKGQRALTREVLMLVGHTRPDKIELEKALRRWCEGSWFLDDAAIADADVGPDGRRQLPKWWRLGSRPNLTQMHHDACIRVSDFVDARLIDDIAKTKSLTAGAAGMISAPECVHMLPSHPREIGDNGDFHYAVLGPKAASDHGKPSAEARRFLDETTGPDKPRVYRNAIVLVAPARDGLEAARSAVRDYLGWEEVTRQLRDQELDATRDATLATNREPSRKSIPSAIAQAYCIVISVSPHNEAEAFRITVGDRALFMQIKADPRSRIQDTAVDAQALLPGGPYDLWRESEPSRRVKDLVGAFAQLPRLPKMLNRQAIMDTLVAGCVDGLFVLRLARPDRSVRTFWRERPDDIALSEPALEAVLPEHAVLSDIPSTLLTQGALPGLWEKTEISLQDVHTYFAGSHVVKIRREGYDDVLTIPTAEPETVDSAVRTAVKDGRLWLVSGSAGFCGEDIPAGLLTGDALLLPPPQPISIISLLPDNLPDAWREGVTTALALSLALSKKQGRPLPWPVVSKAIQGALTARYLERTVDSGVWPCDYAGAQLVRLRLPQVAPPPPPPPPPAPPPGRMVGEEDRQAAVGLSGFRVVLYLRQLLRRIETAVCIEPVGAFQQLTGVAG